MMIVHLIDLFIVTKYQLVNRGVDCRDECVCESVSVRNHCRNTPSDFTKFSVHADVVVQSSSGSFVICYVLPVLWMMSCFRLMAG